MADNSPTNHPQCGTAVQARAVPHLHCRAIHTAIVSSDLAEFAFHHILTSGWMDMLTTMTVAVA